MGDHGASLRDRAGGLRPEPAAQSQPKALIPSAASFRGVERSIRNYISNGLLYRATGKAPKMSGFSYAEVPDWQLLQWMHIVANAASAIEAGTAETAQTGSVHESAVAKPDANPLISGVSNNG